MDISVIVPLYNEAESLPELTQWIERVMKENNFTYEIIFINDGSTDGSWDVIGVWDQERIDECGGCGVLVWSDEKGFQEVL